MRRWELLCMPKLPGSLGLRESRDVKESFIPKLCWQVSMGVDRWWIQLIQSKYLGGRRSLDNEQISNHGSWIWNNILKWMESLKRGLYLKVWSNTSLRIWEDPWIPSIPTFRPPFEFQTPNSPYFISDLMEQGHQEWDRQPILQIFPEHLANAIFKINIPLNVDQDTPIWTSSSVGTFYWNS